MERIALILLLSLAPCSIAAPSEYPMDETRAMNYLMGYGYAGSSNPNPRIASLMDENPSEAMEVGLKIFQDKYGLEVTGILDQPTMDLMSLDRCGNKDVTTMEDMMPMDSMEDGASRRKKRYLVQGNRWPRDHLTYRITQYPADGDLTRSEVDREIARAFQVWSDVTPLRFSISSGQVDIYITFNAYAHGDGSAFDGPGGVLAHAYLPSSGADIEGDSHFDESETWTLGTYSGTNLFQVAAHEFGHALGLGHSDIQSALMAPFYRGYIPNFRLPMDDILGIQSLYGQPGTGNGGSDTTTTTRRPIITFPPNMPNFCEDSHVDAFVGHIENGVHKVYAFQGDYFTLIDGSGIVSGYPKTISSEWRGLPNNIDAALYLEEYSRQYYTWSWETYSYTLHTETSPAYTLFFKGSSYYVFTENRTPDRSNPRPISELGMPRNIDSAFVWARNDRIYVTKGTQYYRFTRGVSPLLTMDSGYPRALSIWNLPVSTVDGAFKSFGGHNFFFKDQQFYLYDNANVQVAAGYPKSISQYVYGCSRNIEAENENEAGTGSEETDITEDGMSSAADTQTVSYAAFMSINCLIVLMVLCVL